MEFLNLSLKDLYDLLEGEDKIIADFFLNYPRIDVDALNKIGFNLPINDKVEIDSIAKKSFPESLDHWKDLVDRFVPDKSRARYIKNPLFYALYKYKKYDNTFAWWCVKSEKFKLSRAELAPYVKYFISCKPSQREILPYVEKLVDRYSYKPLLKNDNLCKYVFIKAVYDNEEEAKDLLEKVYYPLSRLKFISINDFDNKRYYDVMHLLKNGKQKTFDSKLKKIPNGVGVRSFAHEIAKNIDEKSNRKIFDVLLKFKDLDVNVKNPRKAHFDADQENPGDNQNSLLHQLFRMAEYVKDKRKIDKYVDRLIELGAELNYKNNNGESIVMTAIHHGYAHGVEVCKDLLYPEILQDMYKLNGISDIFLLDEKVVEALHKYCPEIKDRYGFSLDLRNKYTVDALKKVIDECDAEQRSNGCLNYSPYGDLIKMQVYPNILLDMKKEQKASSFLVIGSGMGSCLEEHCPEIVDSYGWKYDNYRKLKNEIYRKVAFILRPENQWNEPLRWGYFEFDEEFKNSYMYKEIARINNFSEKQIEEMKSDPIEAVMKAFVPQIGYKEGEIASYFKYDEDLKFEDTYDNVALSYAVCRFLHKYTKTKENFADFCFKYSNDYDSTLIPVSKEEYEKNTKQMLTQFSQIKENKDFQTIVKKWNFPLYYERWGDTYIFDNKKQKFNEKTLR